MNMLRYKAKNPRAGVSTPALESNLFKISSILHRLYYFAISTASSTYITTRLNIYILKWISSYLSWIHFIPHNFNILIYPTLNQHFCLSNYKNPLICSPLNVENPRTWIYIQILGKALFQAIFTLFLVYFSQQNYALNMRFLGYF